MTKSNLPPEDNFICLTVTISYHYGQEKVV